MLELTVKYPEALEKMEQVLKVKRFSEAMKTLKEEQKTDQPPPVDANAGEKSKEKILQFIQDLLSKSK